VHAKKKIQKKVFFSKFRNKAGGKFEKNRKKSEKKGLSLFSADSLASLLASQGPQKAN